MTRKKRLSDAIDRLAALFEYGALQAATDPAEFLNRVATEVVGLRALRAAPPSRPETESGPRFRLEGKGLIDTTGGFDRCTGCGQLPPHAGCKAICAACAPPTGACYCAGCTVAGKGAAPPAETGEGAPAPSSEPVGCNHHGPGCPNPNPYPAPSSEERCEKCHAKGGDGVASEAMPNGRTIIYTCPKCGTGKRGART